MAKRVIYIIFQPLDNYPPSIAQVCQLRDLGYEVCVLTTQCSAPARKMIAAKGITCHYFTQLQRRWMLYQRGLNFFNYTFVVHRLLRQYRKDTCVLWLGTEQTAMKFWPIVRRLCPTIVSAMEFYEQDWYQRGMKKLAPQADVLTACEPHRAGYMVDWWGLHKMPYILPNKPYGPIPPKGPGSTPELQAAIRSIQGKKVLLYQGGIQAERDLSLLAKALAKSGSDYYLVLAGKLFKDSNIDQLLQIYDKTIYLGYFPAPSHLEITPYATVAVAYYTDDCINTRYCAPNKIYEYAGFGVPMLCNTIPGLMDTVGAAGAAECVDFTDPDAILDALDRIDADYDTYRENALAFYRRTDNLPVIAQIADEAFSYTKAGKL